MGHVKAQIKNKSIELFSLLYEVGEAFEESVETIRESLASKQAKVRPYNFNPKYLIDKSEWISSLKHLGQ